MGAIKSYIINLDRNPERMASMRTGLDALGVQYERFNAVDGTNMPQADFDAFKAARPRGGRSTWNRGQMGCFLSQYALWEKAANSPDPYTAIFEDDMHMSASIADFLNDDSWIPAECDIVRMETSTTRLLLSKWPMTNHKNRSVYKVESTSWCAGGYILKRECAQMLIAIPPVRHETADHFLFCHENPVVAGKITIAQVSPALCIQDKFYHANANDTVFKSEIITNHEGSTIQARLKYLFKRSPVTFIKKSLKGYKRVHYAA